MAVVQILAENKRFWKINKKIIDFLNHSTFPVIECSRGGCIYGGATYSCLQFTPYYKSSSYEDDVFWNYKAAKNKDTIYSYHFVRSSVDTEEIESLLKEAQSA